MVQNTFTNYHDPFTFRPMEKSPQANNNFRIFLKEELARRCQKNPSYSLRSFAKLLGISHSALSQIMSGKRPLTEKAQTQITKVLAPTPEQLIQYQISREISFEEQFQKLEIEQFDIFSNWIHDAILELTHLRTFKPNHVWIAKVLEVSVHEVRAATERLVRAKLLKIERSGKWIDQSHYNTNNHLGDFNNLALRNYQKQVLEKSIVALEQLPREERDHTSLMLKFSSKNIKEAKALIKDFRTKFSVKAKGRKTDEDEVFVLNVSFFPISKVKESL